MRESAKHGHVNNSSASVKKNSDMSEILTAAIIKSVSHAFPNLYKFLLCFSFLTMLFTSDCFFTHMPHGDSITTQNENKKNILLVGDLEDDPSGNLAFFETLVDAVEPISRRP